MGNLIEAADSSGKAIRYGYDERVALVEVRGPDGSATEIDYDDRGDPARVHLVRSAAAEQVADYAYDGLRRLRRVAHPAGPDGDRRRVVTLGYDGMRATGSVEATSP